MAGKPLQTGGIQDAPAFCAFLCRVPGSLVNRDRSGTQDFLSGKLSRYIYNYLSLDRVQDPDQVIRLFANDIAMQGPDKDGKLPFGSIIVGEIYKARLDSEGEVITCLLYTSPSPRD